MVHSASVSWSNLCVQQALCIILLWTCNPWSMVVCSLAFLKGVMTARNHEHDFKTYVKVTVVTALRCLWMFFSAQERSGAWKYQANAHLGWMETRQGNATVFPLNLGVGLEVVCFFQLGHFLYEKCHFFISWKNLSKEPWRGDSYTEALAMHPAGSCCSGSISYWWTPGFITACLQSALVKAWLHVQLHHMTSQVTACEEDIPFSLAKIVAIN